ncbi:MAG: acyltransferase family protein [Candidatus Bipolaricaulota bacterium]|nr:acyltransferase family protein [Candidatus Bipolaricaulota bacterium]
MAERDRLYYFDNLKVALTVLLIAHHVGQAYGPTGGTWPIQETARAALLGPFFTVNRSFFMSLFFLISGYFTAMSYGGKEGWPFVKSRLLRLGVPLLVFALLMIPLEIFVFGAPGSNGAGKAWPIDVGYMWYVEHLLIFSLGYALWRAALGRRTAPTVCASRPLRVWHVLVFSLILAPVLAVVRIPFPIDRWDYLLGFFRVALADVPRDLAFFVLGIVAFRRNWLKTVTAKAGRNWLILGVGLAAFWYAYSMGLYRVIPLDGVAFDVVRVTWEALLCSSLSIGLIVLFRERINVHGRLAVALGKSQYASYIFHVPVILAFQFAILNVSLPPLAKFALVTLASVPATFAIANAVRRPLHL